MERSRVDVEIALRQMEALFGAQSTEICEGRPAMSTIREIREGHKRLARIVGEYMDRMEDKP